MNNFAVNFSETLTIARDFQARYPQLMDGGAE
jgi:hypothetical protein